MLRGRAPQSSLLAQRLRVEWLSALDNSCLTDHLWFSSSRSNSNNRRSHRLRANKPRVEVVALIASHRPTSEFLRVSRRAALKVEKELTLSMKKRRKSSRTTSSLRLSFSSPTPSRMLST